MGPRCPFLLNWDAPIRKHEVKAFRGYIQRGTGEKLFIARPEYPLLSWFARAWPLALGG